MNMHRADLHAPTANEGEPMADIRDTAQWYTVNSQMQEIQKVLTETTGSAHRGMNWERLPMFTKDALRRELYRIRAIGEEIDRRNQAAEQIAAARPSTVAEIAADEEARDAAAEGEVKLMVSTKTGIKAWCVVWFGKMYPFPEDEGGHRTAVSALDHFRDRRADRYTDNPNFVEVSSARTATIESEARLLLQAYDDGEDIKTNIRGLRAALEA